MNFAFCTCVELGFSCLRGIVNSGGKLDLALTLKNDAAPTKSGRVYIDKYCRESEIPIININHINDDTTISAIRSYNIDWLFLVGWSQIANSNFLNSVNQGVIGAHPTLLPRGRGRASIPWAILKNENPTGVSFFKLDSGVDTGPILVQQEIPLDCGETAYSLYDKVADVHSDLAVRVFKGLVDNTLKPIPQNSGLATIWSGRTPADGILDPTMSTNEADRLVRACTKPYPGAFIFLPDGKQILKIWSGHKQTNEQDIGKGTLIFSDGNYVIDEMELAFINTSHESQIDLFSNSNPLEWTNYLIQP